MIQISQLYDEQFDSVYKYVYFRVRNVQDTEDIVSNVFLKVVEHIDTYSPQAGATDRSWLFAIVRNTLIDHYRKKRIPTVSTEEAEEEPETRQIQDRFDHDLKYQQVLDCIQELPDRQKEIVILKYQSGLKNKEIALLLEIDQRSVASALSKAQATLRKKLPTRI